MLIIYFFGNRLMRNKFGAVAEPVVMRAVVKTRPKKYATRVCDLKTQPVDGTTPVSQLF